jgi:hypothetical protein
LIAVLLFPGQSDAQQVEVIDDYPVSLIDSVNTPISPEMYFNLQCINQFNGVMYADLNMLDFTDSNEAVAFFQKCPYSFLNINIVSGQNVAFITFEYEILTEEQKLWSCRQWGMFFKNAVSEQRVKVGFIDFRK